MVHVLLEVSTMVTVISMVPAPPLVIEADICSCAGWQLVLVTAVEVLVEVGGTVEVVVVVGAAVVVVGGRRSVVVVVVRPACEDDLVLEGVLEQAAAITATRASASNEARRPAVTNRSLRA